jgi:MFS family permease
MRSFRQFSYNARLFLLATIVSGITLSAMQLFFNLYLKRLEVSAGFMGLLNAIPAGAALIAGVPMGILSDHLGRRRAMLIGLGLSTLAAWGLVSTPYRSVMVLMACFKGAADSLYILSQAPFMMRVAEGHQRTLLFSLNWGLSTLSGAVGNLVAGQLPAWFGARLGFAAESASAYQAVLVASVLCGGLAFIPVWLIREVKQPGPRRDPPLGLEDFRKLVRPSVLRLATPNFIIGFGAAILVPYMNVFFKKRFEISDAELGALFGLSAALTGAAAVIGPAVARRLNSKIRAVVLTQAASLFFLLVLGFAPNYWLAAPAFLMRAALMNMASPLYTAFAMECASERERGAVNNIMQWMWNVGWTVGPYLSAVVQARWGFSPLFAATAGLYAAAIGFTWLFFRHAEAEPQPAVEAALPVE